MTTIEDRAQDRVDDRVDVVLAREAHGAYRLENTELAPADDLSPKGKFPKYGDYLAVTKLTRGGKENGAAFVECPQGLAEALVENEVGPGDVFVVRNVAKNTENRWVFEVETELPED